MIVWIVMDTENETGLLSIKGVFANEKDAREFVAKYVLENDVDTTFLDLFKKTVQGVPK